MPSISFGESNDHHLRGMAKTRSMRARDVAPWSDLGHDVLLLIMMQLPAFDFLAFSGVCKSWRSLALNHRKRFMKSRSPMNISFSDRDCHEKTCFLQDYAGRKFETIIPHLAGRTCVGVTCGYIILFGENAHDFWLVNPITRRQLHFPNVSFGVDSFLYGVRAILVYSPSLSASVFVILNIYQHDIWFSIAGKGAWNKVSSVTRFFDLHAFNGKIYTLNFGHHICELTLVPEPKLTILETKEFPVPGVKWEFASSSKNLYVVQMISEWGCNVCKLDIGDMKPVSCEKPTTEYAFFLSCFKSSAAVKPLPWAKYLSRTCAKCPPTGHIWLNFKKLWYFPHDSLKIKPLEV